jgi:hypothetical protein
MRIYKTNELIFSLVKDKLFFYGIEFVVLQP